MLRDFIRVSCSFESLTIQTAVLKLLRRDKISEITKDLDEKFPTPESVIFLFEALKSTAVLFCSSEK